MRRIDGSQLISFIYFFTFILDFLGHVNWLVQPPTLFGDFYVIRDMTTRYAISSLKSRLKNGAYIRIFDPVRSGFTKVSLFILHVEKVIVNLVLHFLTKTLKLRTDGVLHWSELIAGKVKKGWMLANRKCFYGTRKALHDDRW